MKTKLRPHNEKLYERALRDLDKSLEGKPSSYLRVTLPTPATKTEVKEARRAIDSTQREFAEVVGVSLETVKAWEAGKRVPEGPATKIIRILRRNRKFVSALATA